MYEVDATYSRVYCGDNIVPGTELGRDYETRCMVKANCYGTVTSVGFNPINHIFLITIRRTLIK